MAGSGNIIEKANSSVIKGKVTIGAVSVTLLDNNPSLLLDFLLKTRKIVVEEYPIPWLPSNLLKEVVNEIKITGSDIGAWAGAGIYNMKIPVVSDVIGEFSSQRGPEAKSNIASMYGALNRGFLVDGLLGTVDGLVDVVLDPFEAVEGINSILAYPKETLTVIWDGIKEYGTTKIVDGSAED